MHLLLTHWILSTIYIVGFCISCAFLFRLTSVTKGTAKAAICSFLVGLGWPIWIVAVLCVRLLSGS